VKRRRSALASKLFRTHFMQRRAEFAVEGDGGELGVDRGGLVGDGRGTLDVDARRPLAPEIGLHVAFEPHAIARRGEHISDPHGVAAARRGDAEGPQRARRHGGRGDQRQDDAGEGAGEQAAHLGESTPTIGVRIYRRDEREDKIADANFSLERKRFGAKAALAENNLLPVTPVEARDQSQIELYGVRVGATIQAHEICDEINVGPIVAQTILQRQLYVRARYAFKLSWEYCLLDPMDVLTINDVHLGLSACPVRIVALEEDEKGLIAVTAEELTAGVSTPVLYPAASTTGSVMNRGVATAPVNPPLIFEPPAALTGGAPQIWVGASGGANGVADPNWGGANVWLSLDDVSYSQIATIAQPLRQGRLTAALPAANGWDAADTLGVDVTESGATLSGATAAAAQQGATRSLVDSEILAYESATLTGAASYALTGLQRGCYGAAGAAHAAGAPFARLDQAVVAYNLPANFIGRTLFFKFQSFNLFGLGVEDLSTCEPYAFTPLGVGVAAPIAEQLAGGVPLDLGAANVAPALADDFGALVGAVTGALDLGLA